MSNTGTPPGSTGQLWEECPCGNEPIYMPQMLCAACWRPGRTEAAEAELRAQMQAICSGLFGNASAPSPTEAKEAIRKVAQGEEDSNG